MKILISRSAKNVGVLYHGTLKESLVHMLRTGMMNLASGKDMASILLVLKKNGITYSFYPTLKDWRKRRSQFSAIITPKATPTRKVRKLDKDIYAGTLALLHCLQNTMSDTDRDVLNRIVKNSSKVDMLVLNTLDYTNMSTYNTQNTMASLAIKTVRLLKRMQLNSTNSIRSYLIKALS